MPNCRKFGLIELASKKGKLILLELQKKKPVFHYRSTLEFLCTKPHEEAITNRKKAVDGNSLNWLTIQWLQIREGHEFKFILKKH